VAALDDGARRLIARERLARQRGSRFLAAKWRLPVLLEHLLPQAGALAQTVTGVRQHTGADPAAF